MGQEDFRLGHQRVFGGNRTIDVSTARAALPCPLPISFGLRHDPA